MKLAGFVLLGIAVSVGVYLLALKWFLSATAPSGACPSGDIGMLVSIFIILPFSVLAGSVVTGFLSYGTLETKWGLFGIAPGLYMGILFVFTMGGGFVIMPFLYLVSLAGVGLGYLLMAGIRRLVFTRSG